MKISDSYVDEQRVIKSLLIVTSLQKREDLEAVKYIREFRAKLNWKPLNHLLIDKEVWRYAVKIKNYDPKFVFCHPEVILYKPATSLYYRCLCALSIKAARSYIGSIESLEAGNPRARINKDKALKMARTYNSFICSIIKNSTEWTLDNGNRTIIATMGITLDGKVRNKIGDIAEARIKTLVLEWIIDRELIISPSITKKQIYSSIPSTCILRDNIVVKFGSEPYISFSKDNNLLAIIEIKGGTDPAGALERYGAATKTFQHAVSASSHCKNFYLGAVFTPELQKRINDDRLVEKSFNIIEILDDSKIRADFFNEIFLHTLRLT